MFCQLKSCQKCSGDLILDGDEWRCWQCGQHYYPKTLLDDGPVGPPPSESLDPMEWNEKPTRLRDRYGRAVRNINSLIVAKDRSDERWWVRNADVIRHLDEGRSVREISALAGRGERQVRVVRERLNDLRASSSAEYQASFANGTGQASR